MLHLSINQEKSPQNTVLWDYFIHIIQLNMK